jgi:hypothetical protein
MRRPVVHTPAGLMLDLPVVPADFVCEFHHAAAWQDVGVGAELSTWYAVDLVHGADLDAVSLVLPERGIQVLTGLDRALGSTHAVRDPARQRRRRGIPP